MALMPVCNGTVTGWRPAMPGAFDSTARRSVVTIGPAPSKGFPERIDDAAKHGVAHRNRKQSAGAAYFVAFLNREEVAENDDADGVFFEVEGKPVDAAGELDHFARHDAGQTVDASDAVAHFDHSADFTDVDARFELFNFLLDYGSDLVGFEFHGRSSR
jgi:hypothetical protein